MSSEPFGQHVAVLAPFGRDAGVLSQILRQAGVEATLAHDLVELAAQLREGRGAALLTEEALGPLGFDRLVAMLGEQAPWSELPVLLLLASDGASRPEPAARAVAALIATGSVTVLQRPLASITLTSAVQSALRARRRQYEVRELLARERAAREQAQEATRMKDEFLASVSHELRTPLSAILIWAHLLEAGRLDAEKARHASRAIASGAEVQSRLIEDLLDVSRMLSGKLRLELRPQRLEPIVQAAAEVVRPTADVKGVRFFVSVEDCGEQVLVDAERAQQIFWNLLSNAVKFTPRGGQVELSLRAEPECLAVVVADTGEGIAPEILPHIFERFRQAEAAPQRRHGGLGLGLSIVQHLVELHGGSIRASSEGPGRGSRFVVRLPIRASR